jgi:D-3-phosphoglycerate dehydrogenase / 2-oxoglutarate reductase
MNKRVLVTDYAWPSLDIERELLAQVDAELVVPAGDGPEELVELARDVDAVLTCWKRVPAAALDAAPRCVAVSRYGIGIDNIPVDHATALGIVVTNVPDFCVDEVSDHTMALVLACSRRIVPLVRATSAGTWDLKSGAQGVQRLRGQTLGVVGYGPLARAVAAKAVPFGLSVLAYSPRIAAHTLDPGVTRAESLEDLLQKSDYVSLHAATNATSRGMIGEAALRLMKPTAYLINTARGALLDEEAVSRAVREHWIAGAALDVLATEPPPPDHPLLGRPDIIVTPHAAFYSEQAIADLQRRAASNVVSALSGQLPPHIVNPMVLERSNCRLRVN